MKAEERKTLEQNDLVAGFDKTIDAVRKGPSRTVVLIVLLVVALVVLFYVWQWMAARAASHSAAQMVSLSQMIDGTDIRALASLSDDKDPESLPQFGSQTLRRERLMLRQLEEFVKNNPRSAEGRLARLRLARLALYLGIRDSASSNPVTLQTARADLELARDQFKQLVGECADQPVLQQEAQLNHARALETLGKFAEAQELYEQIARGDATNPAVIEAKAQAERLKNNREAAEAIFKETLGAKTP